MLYINSACRRKSRGDHAEGGNIHTHNGLFSGNTDMQGESHYPPGQLILQ